VDCNIVCILCICVLCWLFLLTITKAWQKCTTKLQDDLLDTKPSNKLTWFNCVHISPSGCVNTHDFTRKKTSFWNSCHNWWHKWYLRISYSGKGKEIVMVMMQQHSLPGGFQSSGTWCIVGQVVPTFAKECLAFIPKSQAWEPLAQQRSLRCKNTEILTLLLELKTTL